MWKHWYNCLGGGGFYIICMSLRKTSILFNKAHRWSLTQPPPLGHMVHSSVLMRRRYLRLCDCCLKRSFKRRGTRKKDLESGSLNLDWNEAAGWSQCSDGGLDCINELKPTFIHAPLKSPVMSSLKKNSLKQQGSTVFFNQITWRRV